MATLLPLLVLAACTCPADAPAPDAPTPACEADPRGYGWRADGYDWFAAQQGYPAEESDWWEESDVQGRFLFGGYDYGPDGYEETVAEQVWDDAGSRFLSSSDADEDGVDDDWSGHTLNDHGDLEFTWTWGTAPGAWRLAMRYAYTYDEADRYATITLDAEDDGAPDVTTAYSYTASGQYDVLTSTPLTEGYVLEVDRYSYDELDRLIAVDISADGAAYARLARVWDEDGAGYVDTSEYPPGTPTSTETVRLTPEGWVASSLTQTPGYPEYDTLTTTTYAPDGQVLTSIVTVGGVPTLATVQDFDDRGRVTDVCQGTEIGGECLWRREVTYACTDGA